MVSSKGKPTDPKLREEAKEDVKQMPNKDGSGKGQMAAWKAGKISEEYEKRGGDYENEAGSKNEPSKGAPKAKSDDKKDTEVKGDAGEKPKANSSKKASGKKDEKSKAPKAPKKEKKAPAEGTRKSTRVTQKRAAPTEEAEAPAKKTKTAKK